MRHGFALSGLALASAPAPCLAQMQATDSADQSVALEAIYTSDLLSNVRGGIQTGTRVLGALSVAAEFDGGAAGASRLSGRVELQFVHGRSFSDTLTGDAQVVSNIEAPSALRPLEAWVGLAFDRDEGTVRAGLIDLNGQFDVQTIGALFLNSSHGIGPDFSQSGENGPSIFPTTTTALTVEYGGGEWRGRVGAFNAVAGDADRPRRTVVRFPGRDGLLLVGEVERAVSGGNRIYAGAWAYTSRFERIETGVRGRGSRGVYAAVEARLANRGDTTLDVWLRAGLADAAYNPIGRYLGGGFAYGHERRRIGVAIAHARLGQPALRAARGAMEPADRAETIIEATASLQLTDRLAIQPDVQYIVNPGWVRGRKDALVAGLRVSLTLF